MIAARRGLVGLLAAQAVSLTGTRVSVIALPWFVLVTTGSAARTGLVVFCEMAPYVLFKALSGPIVDRAGARRVSVTADLLSVPVVGAIPLLHALGALPFGVLMGMVALAGMARAPGDAAKSTLVPDVADAAGVPLDRVTGLYGMVDRLAQTVGPLLGGALVAWLGPLTALVADAASFGVSAGLIAATTPRGQAGRARHGVAPALAAGPEPGAEVGTRVDVGAGGGADAGTRARDAAGERYLDQLRAGFAFLRGDKLLRAIVLMVATTNLLDTATMTVLIPVWATGHGGPASIGLLGSAVGATAILGSMVAAAAGHRLPRRSTYFLAFIVCGPPSIAVLGLDLPVWAVATVYAVAGLGFGIINPILSASMYERVPRPLLGRVLALVGTLAWAGIPLGGPLGGALVALLGLGKAALATAGSYLLTTLLPALRPEWRELDSRRGHRPPATSAEAAEPATRP